MDFSSISSAQTSSQNLLLNPKSSKSTNQKEASYASKITLVKKGQAGYMKAMDTDNDGKITLEEFNEYCKENGLSEQDKMKLLTCMQVSTMNDKIQKDAEKAKEDTEKDEEKSSKNDEKSVYAKKGDDKYNEEMDLNKNDVVTYAEYIQYLQQQKDKTNSTEKTTEESTDSTNQTEQSNSTTELNDGKEYEPSSIEPEIDSTVEYDA